MRAPRRPVLDAVLSSVFLALSLAGGLRAQPPAVDLSLSKVDTPDPVASGATLLYTVTVSHEGPDDATYVTMDDPLPAGTTFLSLASPAGWSCTTPAVGANGTVSCSVDLQPVGSAVFDIAVTVDAGLASGTVLSNTATAQADVSDPDPDNQSETVTTTVLAPTFPIALGKSDAPDPVLRGNDLTYTLTATNSSTTPLASATLGDALPAGTTFFSLASPAGWSCSTPAVGSIGVVSCSISDWPPGAAAFTLVVRVGTAVQGGTVLGNQATLTVDDSGRTTVLLAAATTRITAQTIAATKTVAGHFFAGGAVTYTVVLANPTSLTQADNPGDEFTDVLPPELALVGASATYGDAVANLATNTVTWNGTIPGSGWVVLTIEANVVAGLANGTTVSNQGTTAYDGDANGGNEGEGRTDDPALPGTADPTSFVVRAAQLAEIPTLGGAGLALLASLLAAAGLLLRRRAGA